MDDSCSELSSSLLFESLELDPKKYRYIKNSFHGGAAYSREIATDTDLSRPADVVIHLDGDDWFAHPNVLLELDKVYRNQRTLVTYGNACSITSDNKNFSEFNLYAMGKKWNMLESDPDENPFPFRKVKKEELVSGWLSAPWCAYHPRTFRYSQWAQLSRNTFHYPDGRYLQRCTDAAVMLPILESCPLATIEFIPDILYVYQNRSNTHHCQLKGDGKEIGIIRAFLAKRIQEEQVNPLRAIIYPSVDTINISNSVEIPFTETAKESEYDEITHRITAINHPINALFTIITPDYLADGLLSLLSYDQNAFNDSFLYIFIATRDEKIINNIKCLFVSSRINLIFPYNLDKKVPLSVLMEEKYGLHSDEYRWGMKSVIMEYIFDLNFIYAIFIDPDIYTVSSITDIHALLFRYNIFLFPHFRSGDNDTTRSVLYKDGFFNGGILSCKIDARKHVLKLSERCLNCMEKNIKNNRYVDQKYYDLFLFEAENIGINLDKGIDYCTWNTDDVIGMISPSQRSYLLKNGRFVRIWHMSSDMLQRAQTDYTKLDSKVRPICAIYICSLLYVCRLLKIISIKACDDSILISSLISKREQILMQRLKKLASNIDMNYFKENISNNPPTIHNISYELNNWVNSLLSSICFDNFYFFSRLIREFMYPSNLQENILLHIIQNDLISLTNDVLVGQLSNYTSLTDILENINYGDIVKSQINNLRSANLRY